MSILPLPHGRRRRTEVAAASDARRVLLARVLVCFAVVGAPRRPWSRSTRSATSRSGRRTPTASCCRPTSGSRRSATAYFQDNARLLTSSISPNGQYLATLTWDDYDTPDGRQSDERHEPVDRVATARPPASDPTPTRTARSPPMGRCGRPDGSTIWVPQTDYVDKFSFDPSTGTATQADAIPSAARAPATPPGRLRQLSARHRRGSYIPSGMALHPTATSSTSRSTAPTRWA